MVTTLALFKRHLPKHLQFNMDYAPPPLWYQQGGSNNGNERGNNNQSSLTSDEIWASQMLPKISDSITVTGCVSILIATHNPTIQELIINLIAGLITISDDAITQMLQVPNILYTQTNKKIPTNETSREKLLQLQMKRIMTRLENLSLLQQVNGPNGASNNDLNRRNSQFQNNNNNNNNEPATPGANPNNRLSIRGALDRSNSKLSTSRTNATSTNPNNPNNNPNNEDEEFYPEEFSSCFSYILSITLMQKNRHLLLAGCADIIIALTKNSPSIMCEFIAKVCTSPLPMIDLHKNANNNRGHHSLKHLYTNQGQNTIEPLHVNPLGAKVIDWAGIKIPLKFLQRYHQIFGTHANNTGNSAGGNTGSHTGTVSVPSTSQGGRGGNDAYTENVKAEYRYAHNRSLLAVCSLLAASHDIVSYVVQLPGAIEVIRLSSSIYSDDELQSRPLTSVSGAHPMQPGSRVNTADSETHSVGSRGGRRPESQSNLPGVIITALNALHLEKQHQTRLKAMMNHAGGGSQSSQSNSRKSSHSGLLHANTANHAVGSAHPVVSISKSTEKLLPSKLKPLLQKLNGPSVATSTSNFTGMTPSLIAGTEPMQQNHSQPIQLSSQMEVKFNATYTKETEQFNLYIQNQNDSKIYQQSLASPLQYYASKQLAAQNRGPLHFQNISKPDPLLASSLKEMEDNIQQTLLQPPGSKAPHLNPSKSPVMFANDLLLQPIGSYALTNSDSNLGFTSGGMDARMMIQSAPVSPNQTGMSASRDFFGRLPIKPNVPRRIEPKDVVIVNESMSKIRKKFQILGENAVKSIQMSGNEFNNGKNYVTLEERARRIYKPAKSAFFGNEEVSNTANNEDENANRTAKEKKTLQSLEVFDRFDDNETTGPVTVSGKTNVTTAAPTPAWKNSNDLFNSTSEKADPSLDNNSSENAHDMMSLYRVRLDNIEFDEQELFDNFKPIFDFNNPEPDYQIDYPTIDEDVNKRNGSSQRNDYELYGLNSTGGVPGSPSTGAGYNSNFYKLKSSLQVDQTSDLLL